MASRNRVEFVLRPRIALGVAADKMHRPAEYDLIDGTAEEGFRALFQLPDEGADYIGERDRGSLRARAFVHQFGAEDAFEGAHMPSLAAAGVLGDGGSAIKDLVVVIAEKQDRGDSVRILERNQQGTVLADGGDSLVRRAEIHPAIERHRQFPTAAAAAAACDGAHACQSGWIGEELAAPAAMQVYQLAALTVGAGLAVANG